MRWDGLAGKRVYVVLRNGKEFSGIVKEVNDVESRTLITILDKFGKQVSFLTSEISLIKEEG